MSKAAFAAIGALGLAGLLAGCAGGMSSPQGTSVTPSTLSQSLPVNNALEFAAKCKSDHGVSVKPCSVKLTVTSPTATVTTKGPTGGTFTFKDNKCTKKDIATVEGSGNTYVVTAGTTSGSCKVVFTDKDTKGKKIGKATLDVTNKV